MHATFFSSWKIPLYLDPTINEEYWSMIIMDWTWFIMLILVRKIATRPLQLWIFFFSCLEYSMKKKMQLTIHSIKKNVCQAWVLHWICVSLQQMAIDHLLPWKESLNEKIMKAFWAILSQMHIKNQYNLQCAALLGNLLSDNQAALPPSLLASTAL